MSPPPPPPSEALFSCVHNLAYGLEVRYQFPVTWQAHAWIFGYTQPPNARVIIYRCPPYTQLNCCAKYLLTLAVDKIFLRA